MTGFVAVLTLQQEWRKVDTSGVVQAAQLRCGTFFIAPRFFNFGAILVFFLRYMTTPPVTALDLRWLARSPQVVFL